MAIIIPTPYFLKQFLPPHYYIVRGGNAGDIVAEFKRNRLCITLYSAFFELPPSLKRVVLYHETGHAIGLKHDDACPLMKPYLTQSDTLKDDDIYRNVLWRVVDQYPNDHKYAI